MASIGPHRKMRGRVSSRRFGGSVRWNGIGGVGSTSTPDPAFSELIDWCVDFGAEVPSR